MLPGDQLGLHESPFSTFHRGKDKYSWKVWEYSSCVIQAINMLFLISGGCNLFWTFWRIYPLDPRVVSQVWHFIVNKIITVIILIYPWLIWIENIFQARMIFQTRPILIESGWNIFLDTEYHRGSKGWWNWMKIKINCQKFTTEKIKLFSRRHDAGG